MKRIASLIMFAVLVSGPSGYQDWSRAEARDASTPTSASTSTASPISKPPQATAALPSWQDPGVLRAIDATGRVVDGGPRAARPDRTVGLFYFPTGGSSPAVQYSKIWNNSETLAADPTSYLTPDSGKWPGPEQAAYWAQPLFGYYQAMDEWVLRRHLEMFVAARIDYLVIDATNLSTHKPQMDLLLRLITEQRAAGIPAPQIVFMTHTESPIRTADVYATYYAPDAPLRYPDAWFHWDGKPLIIGEDPSTATTDFFTFRHAQWPTEGKDPANGWDWISFERPQRTNLDSAGNVEQMAVSVAQNAGESAVFSYTSLYGTDDPPSRSRSYHDGAEDASPQALAQGANFQEEWDAVVAADPETVLILGWNEWTAGNQASTPAERLKFYDLVDTRWSRDIEPMAGGFGDNYYLQMVAGIRAYKGAVAPVSVSARTTLSVSATDAKWSSVRPLLFDDTGENGKRDFPGTGTGTYLQAAAANDIGVTQVARNASTAWFTATTAQPVSLTGPNSMTLYLDTDANLTTGQSGFDVRVGNVRTGSSASVEKWTSGAWQAAGTAKFGSGGTRVTYQVARTQLGWTSDSRDLGVKWIDGFTLDSPLDSYVRGDTAPSGRFAYTYSPAHGQPLGAAVTATAPGAPPSGWTRVEGTDQRNESQVGLAGRTAPFAERTDARASGGSFTYYASTEGRQALYRNSISLRFRGTALKWITMRAPDATSAEVFIDGRSQGVVDLYAESRQFQVLAFERYGLADGPHDVRIFYLNELGTHYHDAFEYGSVAPLAAAAGVTISATAAVRESGFVASPTDARSGAQLNDGDPSSEWRASGTGSWVQYDFGRAQTLGSVALRPGPSGSTVTAGRIDGLIGGQWTQLAVTGSWGTSATVPITASDVTAVRLIATGGDDVRLGSFDVFAPGGSPAPSTAPSHWEFTDGTEGWESDSSDVTWKRSSLTLTPSGEASTLRSPSLAIEPTAFTTVQLGLKNRGPGDTVRVTVTSAGGATAVLTAKIVANDTGNNWFSHYQVALGEVTRWTDPIARIAIAVPADGGDVTLDYVRLTDGVSVAAWQFDDANGDEPPFTVSGATGNAAGGKLTVSPSSAATLTSVSGLDLDVSRHNSVRLNVLPTERAGTAVVEFRTASSGWDPDKRAEASFPAGATSIVIGTSTLAAWAGEIDQLRITLGSTSGQQGYVIQSITVSPVAVAARTKTAWTFDSNEEGWTTTAGTSGHGWSSADGGILSGTITSGDPVVYSGDELWLPIDARVTVEVRMRVTGASPGARAGIYFTTLARQSWSADLYASTPLATSADDYTTYVFDLSGNQNWAGMLKQLRLDPVDVGSASSYQIDSVRVIAGDARYDFSLDAEGWTEQAGFTSFGWDGSGELRGVIGNPDAHLYSPATIGASLTRDPVVTIAMTVSAPSATMARLYWTTQEEPTFSQARSVTVTLTPGGTTYTFDPRSNPGWTGTLTQLRLDPADDGDGTGTIAVDRVRIGAPS